MIGVYKIVNTVNGKYYIGSSVNIENRFKSHIDSLNKGSHNNKYLQNAWNKYGEDNFEFIILEETVLDNLRERENYYIQNLDATNHTLGYNILSDTNIGLGVSASDEVRLKISESCKGEKNGHYGKHHSEETKQRMSKQKCLQAQQKWFNEHHTCENCGKFMPIRYGRSGRFCSDNCRKEHSSQSHSLSTKGKNKPDGFGDKLSKALKGKKFSDEHCRHISESARERLSDPTNNPMYGKHHSEETKKHWSEIRKGVHNSYGFTGKHHSEETKRKIAESVRLSREKKNDQK